MKFNKLISIFTVLGLSLLISACSKTSPIDDAYSDNPILANNNKPWTVSWIEPPYTHYQKQDRFKFDLERSKKPGLTKIKNFKFYRTTDGVEKEKIYVAEKNKNYYLQYGKLGVANFYFKVDGEDHLHLARFYFYPIFDSEEVRFDFDIIDLDADTLLVPRESFFAHGRGGGTGG